MEWVEKRDADYLVSRSGKILGKVRYTSPSVISAEAVYAGGGNHKCELGDYISVRTARDAVEAHVKEMRLPGTEAAGEK